ncbi:MAG: serine hydrolase domain-containing protein [Pseudomonadota bacterium]
MVDTQFLASAPEEVGVSAAAVDELFARVRKEVDEGLLPSCQVALARAGKIAAMASFGDATNDNLYCVFSATKAITSAAGWLVIQDGLLDVGETVADIIPEFGSNGKDGITVEMLFTHTAGFPHAPFRPTDWNDRARRLERFSDWRLTWEPGSRYEYHPTSTMWVIAEIIERKTGRDFSEFVRERIAKPLGLPDLYVGTPASEHSRVKDVVHVGEPMTEADYAALGMPMPPQTEVTPEALLAFNTAEVREVPIGGGGGIMSAGELALFWQALINGGRALAGEPIWTQQTLDFAFEVRNHYPDLLGVSANRALGVIIAGDKARNGRGFGHTNSERAVGHNGAGGQIAWGDPSTGLSLGYVTNGHDAHAVRQARRGISISNRAAVCAGD